MPKIWGLLINGKDTASSTTLENSGCEILTRLDKPILKSRRKLEVRKTPFIVYKMARYSSWAMAKKGEALC